MASPESGSSGSIGTPWMVAARVGPQTTPLFFLVAVGWALFQLWGISPWVEAGWVRGSIGDIGLDSWSLTVLHLAFAIVLAFIAVGQRQQGYPLAEWALALIAAYAVSYAVWQASDLSTRPGMPTNWDVNVAIAGFLLMVFAAYRVFGFAVPFLLAMAVGFSFIGPLLPDSLVHPPRSMARMAEHLWLSADGAFGQALSVSATEIFAFVLLGSLSVQLGALRGIAVVARAVSGTGRDGEIRQMLINLAGGGAFAVHPYEAQQALDGRIGQSIDGRYAGAVLTSGALLSQFAIPIVGGGAFLIAAYSGEQLSLVYCFALLLSLLLLTAALSFLTSQIVPSAQTTKLFIPGRMVALIFGVAIVIVGLRILIPASGSLPLLTAGMALFIGGLARRRHPQWADLASFLPLAIALWHLMIEAASPSDAAFYGCIVAIGMTLVKPFVQVREIGGKRQAARAGFDALGLGLARAAAVMIPVALACASAGIVIGVFGLTDLTANFALALESIGGNSYLWLLLMTAALCLSLGFLPVVFFYAVAQELLVFPILEFMTRAGILVSPIIIHLFLFTLIVLGHEVWRQTFPERVGNFRAALAERSTWPIWWIILRLAIIPFIFLLQGDLLDAAIGSVADSLLVVAILFLATMLMVGVLQRRLIAPLRWWESLVLLVIVLSILRPTIWMDTLYPPVRMISPLRLSDEVASEPEGGTVTLKVLDPSYGPKPTYFTTVLPLGDRARNGVERLAQQGLQTAILPAADGSDRLVVTATDYASPAQEAGLFLDNVIVRAGLSVPQPDPRLVYIPAIFTLLLLLLRQRRRR